MNSNKNQINTNTNDVWVPVKQASQNPQRSYGTVEFTAVPNQTLNTEINPLGVNTMIFNPYTMQNQSYGMQNQSSNFSETIIQPVIQPVIQTVYQQPKTRILEPIVNEPIMATPNNPYGDYSQYLQNTTMLMMPGQQSYETSEFKFDNDNNNQQKNYTAAPQGPQNQPVQQNQPVAPAAAVNRPVVSRPAVKRPVPVKTVAPKVAKPKSKKTMLYTIMGISAFLTIGIVVVIALLLSGVIAI